MNVHAICREVITAGGLTTISALIERTGLSEGNLNKHLSTLCGEGVLIRERERVKIKNKALASEYARTNLPGPLTVTIPQTPATFLAPIVDKPVRVRIELPVGLPVYDAVPMPERRIGAVKRPIVLPFAQMKVGQCVLLAIPDGIASTEMANRCRAEVNAYQKRIDDKFYATVRATVFPKDHKQFGEPCIGVWRIATVDAVIAQAKHSSKGKRLSAVK